MFGLDFPYTKPGQIQDAMKTMRECTEELQLDDDAVEKVFGGNLLRMIGREV